MRFSIVFLKITRQIAGIIGGKVRVEVADTLEMVGSIINSLTGDLEVKAGKLAHSDIADSYKEGARGFGLTGGEVHLRYGDKEGSGTVRSVIGEGKLEVGSTPSAASTAAAEGRAGGEGERIGGVRASIILRDPARQITRGSVEGGEIDADLPIREIWNFVKAKAEEYRQQKEASRKALVEVGADVDAVGPGGYTALHWAAQKGHTSVVQAERADINAQSKDGTRKLNNAKDYRKPRS